MEETLGKGKKKQQIEDEEAERKRNELKKEMTQYIFSERIQNVGNLLSSNILQVLISYFILYLLP